MSDELRAPPITRALIEWLERVFPDRVARMEWTDREVWANVGIHRVIERLRAEHKLQTENLLENTTDVHKPKRRASVWRHD